MPAVEPSSEPRTRARTRAWRRQVHRCDSHRVRAAGGRELAGVRGPGAEAKEVLSDGTGRAPARRPPARVGPRRPFTRGTGGGGRRATVLGMTRRATDGSDGAEMA